MDCPTGIFLKGKRLHHDVVLRVCRCLDVHETINSIVCLEQVGVGILAELALKVLPEKSGDLCSLFALHLHAEPIFEAGVVDEAD